jgi:hypothetical protein
MTYGIYVLFIGSFFQTSDDQTKKSSVFQPFTGCGTQNAFKKLVEPSFF